MAGDRELEFQASSVSPWAGPHFWQPLIDFRRGRSQREAAVQAIAARYREFVDVFENARAEATAA
jgi:hypothetical protein